MTLELRVVEKIADVPAQAWDALVRDDASPFVEHTWLACLEEAGCVGERAGWLPRHLVLYEIDGQSAGVCVMIPNLNEAIRGLNGKLLPFGWATLLWRLKVKRVKSTRVPLMGVRKAFANSPRSFSPRLSTTSMNSAFLSGK